MEKDCIFSYCPGIWSISLLPYNPNQISPSFVIIKNRFQYPITYSKLRVGKINREKSLITFKKLELKTLITHLRKSFMMFYIPNNKQLFITHNKRKSFKNIKHIEKIFVILFNFNSRYFRVDNFLTSDIQSRIITRNKHI